MTKLRIFLVTESTHEHIHLKRSRPTPPVRRNSDLTEKSWNHCSMKINYLLSVCLLIWFSMKCLRANRSFYGRSTEVIQWATENMISVAPSITPPSWASIFFNVRNLTLKLIRSTEIGRIESHRGPSQ